MRHNQAQRGYLMVQAGLALALTGLATAAAVIAKQVSDDAASASAQADALTIVSQAVDALVMDSSNYAKYQAGLAITRNGVTIPFGSSLGQSLSPTVAQLKTMGLGIDNASETGFYKSLAGAGYVVKIQRVPSGCELSPNPTNGSACNVTGQVCFDQPVKGYQATAGDVDGPAMGVMLLRLGGNGGISVLGSQATITGSGAGWSVPNPISGTPAGIVCKQFGFGASGFASYLRERDTRNPDFQGGMTITGTNAAGESLTVNGTTTIAQNLNLSGALVLNSTGVAGAACSPENATVWGTIATLPALLTCRSGFYVSAVPVALAGGSCTPEGRIAQSSAGASLVCRDGKYRPVVDLLGRQGLMSLTLYQHGQTATSPTCDAAMIPRLIPLGVVAACVVGGGTCANNTGSFQGTISTSNVVSITGSDGSVAGTAQLTVAAVCSTF